MLLSCIDDRKAAIRGDNNGLDGDEYWFKFSNDEEDLTYEELICRLNNVKFVNPEA